ncbi:MAG: Ig-like domain-containing protein [Candidatus Loosdrechtia sp.]|uniref:Ig-like domain-containing protein n=1 Tax=Candidatus Loosdrechtia sp. TaxID=3101272 RepID=UPI003A74B21E|nr:MAG: Ig-like domain-containing protein [Candidatus Jettenia sp. AMX2]
MKINAADSVTGQGSNTTLIGKDLYICFTVNESVVIPNINTTLTVDQQCVLLNAGEVDLKATLKESNSNSKPISEAIIYFYINPELDPDGNLTGNNEDNYIGYATTNEDGIATLTFNVNGLGVEDHNLYAEYRGYSNYNPSNDSNTPWH